MKSINSLSEFIERLDESDIKTLPKIIKSVAIPLSEFEKYATWNQENYTRNCIARTDTYELILLCWEKNQETPIHEHGGQKCWVYQVNGEVDECRYQKDESGKLSETLKIELSAGNITYMDTKMGYHTLKNSGNQRAMTLHVYVNPIDSCTIFCDEKKDFITKELEYDSLVKEI